MLFLYEIIEEVLLVPSYIGTSKKTVMSFDLHKYKINYIIIAKYLIQKYETNLK